MELKRSLTLRSALGLAAAAGLTGALAVGSPALAATVVIDINGGNVPTTAEDFKDNSCGNLPEGTGAGTGVDGWVFVLPASAGVDGNFISVTATFEDEGGDEHVLTTGADGGIVSGSGNNKAYILTPGGWTLTGAEAEVEDPAEGAFFNLTHACPGGPDDNPSSPEESPSAPVSESPSAPGSESPTVPGEESTTPAGSTLPTTGTPLTVALIAAAALAAAGAVLFTVRRRREAQDW